MIVTVPMLKAQLNQTLDDDDTLIERKIAAAQDQIERLLGFKIEAIYGGEGQEEIPPALVECVCQLAAHWYENREAVLVGVSAQSLPHGVHEIVREYREYTFG